MNATFGQCLVWTWWWKPLQNSPIYQLWTNGLVKLKTPTLNSDHRHTPSTICAQRNNNRPFRNSKNKHYFSKLPYFPVGIRWTAYYKMIHLHDCRLVYNNRGNSAILHFIPIYNEKYKTVSNGSQTSEVQFYKILKWWWGNEEQVQFCVCDLQNVFWEYRLSDNITPTDAEITVNI